MEAARPSVRLYTLQGDIASESSIRDAAVELSLQGAPPVRGLVQAAVVMVVCRMFLLLVPFESCLAGSWLFPLALIFLGD